MEAPFTIRKPGPRCTRDEGSGSPGSFFLEGGERLRGGVVLGRGGPGYGVGLRYLGHLMGPAVGLAALQQLGR